jgi:hypothetical protein
MSDLSNVGKLAKVASAVTGDVHVEVTIASDAGPNQEEIDAVTAFMGAATPAAVLELFAEIDRLRTAEGDAMTYKAGMENVAQQRDQLKIDLEQLAKKIKHSDYWHGTRFETLFHWAHRELNDSQKNQYFSIVANGSSYPDDPPTYAQQMNQLKWKVEAAEKERDMLKAEVERLKHEHRLLTEHNEFLASSDSRLAPELRAVKDALGLDFTASVSGEVVPLIERLRKLPTCWTEVLEQSEANDQLLDQVLELSKYADRWKWLEGSADSATWEQIGYQEHMNRHLHVDAAMAKGK